MWAGIFGDELLGPFELFTRLRRIYIISSSFYIIFRTPAADAGIGTNGVAFLKTGYAANLSVISRRLFYDALSTA
ncbi:hypothetical protein ANN_02999 [Periplaneta americana]|uniref:Uncharacterized protein n=1 Tax=Periplaneta americana TaxID=6978 RepID=A0ABQ8U1K4_PERAM|nr:hypothetical protein ANN_02999 [Periplaneta americana]